MSTIIAGACPVCTLSVQQLAQPFVGADEDAEEQAAWAV